MALKALEGKMGPESLQVGIHILRNIAQSVPGRMSIIERYK